MARNSVQRIDSVSSLELQDENEMFNIDYFINSEILSNILNEAQLTVLFSNFSDNTK